MHNYVCNSEINVISEWREIISDEFKSILSLTIQNLIHLYANIKK